MGAPIFGFKLLVYKLGSDTYSLLFNIFEILKVNRSTLVSPSKLSLKKGLKAFKAKIDDPEVIEGL